MKLRNNSKRSPVGFLVCSLWIAAGCSGTPSAFSTRFPDNRTDDVAALVTSLESAGRRDEPGVAVGVTTDPVGLYAYDLSSHRVLWHQTTQLSSSPVLAGTLVIVQDGDRIIGRALTSGDSRFAVNAEGMQLIGADGDSRGSVLVLSRGVGTMSHSLVLFVENGSVAWTRELPFQAGSPALSGDLVLVPWGNQYLSAISRHEGVETARVRVTDGVLAQAFVRNGIAYTGSEEGVTQVNSALARGSIHTDAFLAAPADELPGDPAFVPNVYRKDRLLSADSARHSIKLAWNPARGPDGRVGVTGGVVYLVFYRFVFALNYPSLSLRWIHAHGADIVGAEAQASGLSIADNTGTFALLDGKGGGVVESHATDLASTAVVLPASGPWPSRPAEEAAPHAARKQLLMAAEDPDSRLVPVRRLAVKLLAALDDPEATSDLLRLCDDDRTSPAVRRDACEALSNRGQGMGDVLKGLERHQDYLAGTRTPPVGALAKAAHQQKEKRAVPALVQHLRDPQTRPEDLAAVVAALAALDPQAAIEPITGFVLLYHADGIDEHVVKGLEAAVMALASIGGPEATATLRTLANDPMGLRGVREKAAAMLAEIERSARMAAQQKKQAGEETAVAPEAAEPVEPDEPAQPPAHLTLALVQQALLPVIRPLRACLTAGDRNLFRARIILVVEDDKLQLVSVLPPEVQSCVEPLVRSQAFPKTLDASRQQISYTLTRK